MDSRDRVVLRIPMTELWREDGELISFRKRELGVTDVRELLRVGPVEYVVADVGLKLQWIPVEETFAFWKHEVMRRLVQLPHEGSRIPDHAYVASEWITVKGKTVLLLEKYH